MDQTSDEDKTVFSFQDIAESHKNLSQLLKKALAVIDKNAIKEVKYKSNETESIKIIDIIKEDREKFKNDALLSWKTFKYSRLQRHIATVPPMQQLPPLPPMQKKNLRDILQLSHQCNKCYHCHQCKTIFLRDILPQCRHCQQHHNCQ